VSNSALVSFCLLAVLLAGCSTAPRPNTAQVPDWQERGPEAGRDLPPVTSNSNHIAADTAGTPHSAGSNSVQPVPRFTAAPTVETWTPLGRWSKANGFAAPIFLAATPLPSYALRSSQGVLVLHTGNQLAHWDGIELHLGYAPQLIGGQPYVHGLDLRTSLQPLLSGGPAPCLSARPVVVLDPGHGGTDSGTHSVLGHYEKEFTLDWARRLQALLATNGWQVLLTRSGDFDLALSNRVAFAEEHKADLFLSLHFNSAAPNQAEAGLETYVLTPSGMASNLTRGFADDADALFPNNAFDTQNLLLAVRVHGALLQVNGHRDRGVRHARFPGVLRGQQRPAILVEGGYLSNPREAGLIGDGDYRQKLAEAVAGALETIRRQGT
jgi:N-acetylmuramoyl-L-alanine amidase